MFKLKISSSKNSDNVIPKNEVTFAIVENGSWAPNVTKNIMSYIEKMKNSKIIENTLTIKSSLKSNQKENLIELAETIAKDIQS